MKASAVSSVPFVLSVLTAALLSTTHAAPSVNALGDVAPFPSPNPQASWDVGGPLSVGSNATGTVTITDGGALNSTITSLGVVIGSTGTVTVDGASSAWTNSGDLYIGRQGSGTLNVTSGGHLTSGDSVIGGTSGGTGAVTIDGSGSQWNVTSLAGIIRVGGNGTGSLTITNGGDVTAKTLYTDMANLHGNGTIHAKGLVFDSAQPLILDGTDTNTFGNGGALHLDMDGSGVLGVGYKSSGYATINSGTTMRSSAGYLGMEAGSGGSVTVTGNRTVWLNSGALLVGNNGSTYSQLSIEAGAAVGTDTATLSSGSGPSQSSTIYLTGTDSVLEVINSHIIGEYGTAVIQATSGSRVLSGYGFTVLGKEAGSLGRVIIDNAAWDVWGALVVGEDGAGDIRIINGGTLGNTGVLVVNDTPVAVNAQSRIEIGAGSLLTAPGVIASGELLVDGGLSGVASILSGGSIGGDGVITGDLILASATSIVFSLNKTLSVIGTVSIDSSFGIANLLGLDDSVANGIYTLIDRTSTDFSTLGLKNWGVNNAYDLGGGKSAYFQQGSLQVVVIPEPSASTLLLLGTFGLIIFATRRSSNCSSGSPLPLLVHKTPDSCASQSDAATTIPFLVSTTSSSTLL